MRLAFRQGIVSSITTSSFQSVPAGPGISITLNVAGVATPVVIQFAHGTANYLLTERLTVPSAWLGPFLAGINYYLYWDINTTTGLRTFGATQYNPLIQAIAPIAPVLDQHWFDTINKQMKVWNGFAFIVKIRVFAGALLSGVTPVVSMSINAPSFLGTQVGASTPADANTSGYLVFSGVTPLKKGDGTFFTTEDTATIGLSNTTDVKFSAEIISGVAGTFIGAYTMVKFSAPNALSVFTNFDGNNVVYGIIEQGVSADEEVNVVTSGLVRNDAWTWSAVNIPLYPNGTGTLTTTRPANDPDPVAITIDSKTILVLSVNSANLTTNSGVTSIALSDGSTLPIYAISGSPITSAGTLSFTLNTQSANLVFAGPTTASAEPTFRSLVNNDLPISGVVAGTYNTLVVNTRGVVTSASNIDYVNVTGDTMTGDLIVNGTVIGRKDNATSMRVKGPQALSEGGADVQSYSGIFYNDAYVNTGTLKTRVIHGANIEMDMEIQSPHQVRLVAVDDGFADGKVYLASKTNFVFNARANAEVASPRQLIIDRVNTVTTGGGNNTDVDLTVNTGNLNVSAPTIFSTSVKMPVYTVGTLPTVFTGAVTGAVIYVSNAARSPSGTGSLAFYDGTSWVDVTTGMTVV